MATLGIVLLRSIYNFLQVMQIFIQAGNSNGRYQKLKFAGQANFFGLT
jgi:hypothetical protein